jgi:hypothetical protein
MPRTTRKAFVAETESEKIALQLQEEEQQEVQEPQVEEIPSPTRGRRKKNVFNGTQLKLTVNQTIPGYHLHIFTDDGNRIYDAEEAGYEFVSPSEIGGVSENVTSRNTDLGDKVRFLVNPRTGEGSAKYGYLMKQREEWFREDQAALASKNNLIDKAIRKGNITGQNPNFYVPTGGIKVSQG